MLCYIDSISADDGVCEIFFSLRFNSPELMQAAQSVQAELVSRGINAVIIDAENGQNVEEVVIRTLDKAKLVVIFGSKDYGVNTGSLYSSYKELELTLRKKKPFFLIKMCKEFEDIITFNRLPDSLLDNRWDLGQPMPTGLIDAIETKFRAVN